MKLCYQILCLLKDDLLLSMLFLKQFFFMLRLIMTDCHAAVVSGRIWSVLVIR
jgi:hypothetical protein